MFFSDSLSRNCQLVVTLIYAEPQKNDGFFPKIKIQQKDLRSQVEMSVVCGPMTPVCEASSYLVFSYSINQNDGSTAA